MEDNDLKSEIKELINRRAEGDYWDFKHCWYEHNIDLIHGIMCMANSPANRDCYIIIGVEDKTFKIIEVENKKNQQNIIDLLHHKPKWAGGIVPEIYVKTIIIDDNELDVLIIKRSDNTPFYLVEDLKEGQNKLYKGAIYTRIGDTNTPKNETANLYYTELLWKRRLGLLYNPSQRAKFYLKNIENWNRVDGIKDKFGEEQNFYYYMQDPDFTIHIIKDIREDCNKVDSINDKDIGSKFYYLFAFCNIKYHYDFSDDYLVILYYREVPLFSSYLECIDEGRTRVIPPEIGAFPHYIKDSLRYLIFEFIFEYECRNYSNEAKNMIKRVVPLLENENEYNEFSEYIRNNGFSYYKLIGEKMEKEALHRLNVIEVKQYNDYSLEYETIAEKLKDETNLVINFSSEIKENKEEITEYLRIGKMVVKWLDDWRKSRMQ